MLILLGSLTLLLGIAGIFWLSKIGLICAIFIMLGSIILIEGLIRLRVKIKVKRKGAEKEVIYIKWPGIAGAIFTKIFEEYKSRAKRI